MDEVKQQIYSDFSNKSYKYREEVWIRLGVDDQFILLQLGLSGLVLKFPYPNNPFSPRQTKTTGGSCSG